MIALLDDSSDDDDNPVPKLDRKRKAAAATAARPCVEDEIMEMESSVHHRNKSVAMGRAKTYNNDGNDHGAPPFIPFYLFETTSAKLLSSTSPTRKYFQSLRQAIGFDSRRNNRQIQFLILSNFLIDFRYLYEKIPDIIHIPRVLVFYGSFFGGENHVAYIQLQELIMKNWKSSAEHLGNCVEFRRLIPSDPPKSKSNPLSVKIQYGCHHTKMFLLGFIEEEDHVITTSTTTNNSADDDDCTRSGSRIESRRQSMIRVVVHTANLGESDVERKTNGLYAQNFPLKQNKMTAATDAVNPYKKIINPYKKSIGGAAGGYNNNATTERVGVATKSTCSFENDLADYLESYGYETRQSWSAPTLGGENSRSKNNIREARLKKFGQVVSDYTHSTANDTAYPQQYKQAVDNNYDNASSSSRILTSQELSLPELIRQYDYSSAYATLIPSIPGYHRGISMNKYGYLKLRKEIVDDFTSSSSSSRKKKAPIICQISSLGSLHETWLRKFCSAIDYTSTHNTNPIDDMSNANNNKPLQSVAKIIWPTVDEIRMSVEGFAGGGSVPGRESNLQRPFLKPLYHRWSKRHDGDGSINDPFRTARHVPHIKTFVQPSSSHDNHRSIEWLLLTSHNLSTAAWGTVQNNKKTGGKELFIRHWELGVFFSPATLLEVCGMTKPVRILPIGYGGGGVNDNGTINLCDDDKSDSEFIDVYVPIPYDVHTPDAYDGRDHYWTVDPPPSSMEPDDFGRYG